MNNCIFLICSKPNEIWLDFLSTFKIYDVYIIIDDNTNNYQQLVLKYTTIHFIQIDKLNDKNEFRKQNLELIDD